MRRGRELFGWFTLVLILACPLALSGADTESQGPKTPIAHLEVQASRIDWHPKMDYERLVLTVAGPAGIYIHQVFEAGQAPQFSLANSKGDRLPDGSYAYELRVVPRLGEKLPEQLLVQSGFLSVQEGSFVDLLSVQQETPSPSEPPSKLLPRDPATKDIVQNDDLIVQEQACIGSGCVVGDANVPALKLKELFDTLIVFENDGCCHPSTRNWALQANDAINTKGDFLIRDLTQSTIPFRIGEAAPDNALTIFPFSGNIGLGTLTPAVRLDVKASAAGQVAARLQNSSATGHSGIHYLDAAGNIDLYFGIDNAASTTRLDSVNNNPILILTNSAERMRVTSTGNVGIGTSNPGARLEVAGGEVRFPGGGGVGLTHFNWPGDGKNYIRGTTVLADSGGSVGIGTSTPAKRLTVKSAAGNDDVMQVVKSSGATSIFRIFETTSGDGLFSVFDNAGSEATRFTSVSGGKLAIGCNSPEHRLDLGSSAGSACSVANPRSFIDAGSVTFTTSSSRFIKENLKPVEVENVLDRISAVKVYNYDFIEGPKDKVGLMAEDFHTIFGRGSDKMLDGQEVEMALWLAVQELTAQNRELKAENKEVNQRLADLEARFAAGQENKP